MCTKLGSGEETITKPTAGADLINPFVHHLELTTTYEKLKAAILTVLVLPLRIFIITSLLICAWILACVGLYGLTDEELRRKPLSGWRLRLRDVVTMLGRGTYYAGGMRYKVKGKQASRKEAPILVIAPHSTFLDAGVVYVTGFPSIIVRRESGLNPFLGKLINFTQPVYVWRDDPNSRQRTIQEIIDRAKSNENWSQVLIFPEGTCTNRSCLITFKPGAFYPGEPVQPVILRYPNKLDTVTWTWEGPGVLKLLWLTLVQPQSNCEIEFLPVYHPREDEKKDPKLYAQNVRQLMANALKIPTLDYTYDDCQLAARAKKLGLEIHSPLLKTQKHRIRLGLSRKQIEEELVKNDPDLLKPQGTKWLNFTEFAHYLSVPTTEPSVLELFKVISKDNTGRIDFREYLISALLVSKGSSKEDMLHLSFQLCGGKEERLNAEDFCFIMKLFFNTYNDELQRWFREIDINDCGRVSYYDFEEYASIKLGKIFKKKSNAFDERIHLHDKKE
ncbi:lysophosphatidylcholine acyltransferase isoform X1 [Lycorma delicatula]|uniref:lysophosphatidylcholine acyltransferase isoform X1 n=1 Tax=Lycorma delicatula TaxID=130591 RepID=UPI003F511DBC